MEKKQDSNEAGAVLGFLVIVLGLLGWWWWQLGDAGRQGWLWAVGRAGGYGPVPGDMAAQLEWLALNRLEDMQGMVGLLMVTGLAGSIEGTARRQTVCVERIRPALVQGRTQPGAPVARLSGAVTRHTFAAAIPVGSGHAGRTSVAGRFLAGARPAAHSIGVSRDQNDGWYSFWRAGCCCPDRPCRRPTCSRTPWPP